MGRKGGVHRNIRDHRGSVHVLETMVVGMMIVGAIVAVSTFENYKGNPDRVLKPQDDTLTEDTIRNLMAMPSNNKTIHMTNLLEERIIQTLRDENLLLEDHIRIRGGGDPYRLILQHEENQTAVLGPLQPPDTIPSTGSTEYVSKLGNTLLQPALSHYTRNTPIHLQSLPVWINRIPVPNGEHYTVELTLEIDDPTKDQPLVHTHTTQHAFRTPHRDHNPLLLSFHTPGGGTQRTHFTESELLTLDGYNWTIHTRLQPSHPNANDFWLHDQDILRVQIPPGWRLDNTTHPAGENWYQLEDSTPNIQRLKYVGPPVKGPGEAWLNLTLTRPLGDPLLHHETLTVQQETRTWSQATLVITPTNPTHHTPITVYPSQPNPFPHDAKETEPEITFTLVNPNQHPADLTGFQVSFPGYRQKGDREGWTYTYTTWDEPTTYTLEEKPTIPGHGAITLNLPVEALQDDGNYVRHPLSPVIQQETPTLKTSTQEFAMHAQGPLGVYESFLSPETIPGIQDTFGIETEGYLPHHIPPGTGSYAYSSTPDAVIEELQRARSTMQLHSDPFHADLDDPIQVSLETGEFLPILREIPGVEEDRVRVNIQAGSLFSHLIEQPDQEYSFDLGLDWGAGVTGLEWIPRSGGGHDLLVGYSDGHAVLLDGTELPESALWRERVGKNLIAGPFTVGNPAESRAAFASSGSLLDMDLETRAVESLPLPGIVQEVAPVDCLENGSGVAVLTSMTHAQPEEGHNVYSSMDLGLYDSNGYQTLGSVLDVGPVGLDSGVFDGACNIVAGFQDAEAMGLVKRYPVTGSASWDLEVPGGLRGVLVVDESSGDDRLVVVTRDSGWFASDGLARDQAERVVFEEWVTGDTLIGLSWVTPSDGYAVTRMGFVWESKDGGISWERWETPVVNLDTQRELVDFAFGGNGDALFLRDDGLVREYHDGALAEGSNEWRGVPDLIVVHGLVETDEGPAVLGVRDREDRTGSYVWDFNFHKPEVGAAVHEVKCVCEQGASGHALGIVAWNTTHVRANTTEYHEWNGIIGADVYAVDPDGHVLSLQEDGNDGYLVKEREGEVERVQLAPDVKNRLSAAQKSGRSPSSAYLLYDDAGDAGLVSLVEGEFRHHSAPATGLVGLSGGPGGPWWVLEDSLQPAYQSDHTRFQVQASGLTEGEEISLRLESPQEGEEVRWRIQGSSAWLAFGQSVQTAWTDSLVLEVDSSKNPRWVLREPDLTLAITPSNGEEVALNLEGSECTSCIKSLVPDQYADAGWRWAPMEGLPASDTGFQTEAPPVVAREGGESYLLGGSEVESYWSHDVTLGLPWRELEINTDPGSDAEITFHVIRTPSGDDVVLGEHGGLGFDKGGLLGPGGAGTSTLYQVEPFSGAVTCSDSLERYNGLNIALGTHHPDSDLVVLGSRWGELTGRESSCGVVWDHAGLEVGSRLNVELEPPGRGWQRGPVIIRAELEVELESQDPISLYFLDAAYRTQGKTMAPEVVIYRAHLHYWWWENNAEGRGLTVQPEPK